MGLVAGGLEDSGLVGKASSEVLGNAVGGMNTARNKAYAENEQYKMEAQGTVLNVKQHDDQMNLEKLRLSEEIKSREEANKTDWLGLGIGAAGLFTGTGGWGMLANMGRKAFEGNAPSFSPSGSNHSTSDDYYTR